MSDWTRAQLSRCVESLDAGVSVNSEDRPHRAGELGVLKTSALSGYVFRPEQNKAVVRAERRLVAEPVLASSILVSRMNTPALVGESCYVADAHETLFLPDRIWQLKLRAEVPTNVRWLSYVLQSHEYRHFVEIHATGTSGSMKNLPKSALLSLPVRYPEEPEQEQIAAVLATIDSAIRYSRAIVEKLKQVKQGLLHDLLTRGLDAKGVLRPSYQQAPHLYQESRLGWIPKDWTLRSVASLGEIKSGSTPSRGKVDRYFHTEGTPWVKTLDLNEDIIRKTDECITDAALRESSCSVLSEDSVLIAMYGGWEQIGRTAMLGVPAATNQAISTVTISDPEVLPEYVLRALQHGRPRWKRVAASTRKDPNITKADVEEFELPMPSTRDEQIAIVTCFRSILTRLEVEQLELHKRRNQKAGVLDDLLTGRVRVTPLMAP